MRLVIDENMSPVIATLLRNYGHDVIAVAEESPRLPDPAVMEWAVREDRILVTSDNDFGALRGILPPEAYSFQKRSSVQRQPAAVTISRLDSIIPGWPQA